MRGCRSLLGVASHKKSSRDVNTAAGRWSQPRGLNLIPGRSGVGWAALIKFHFKGYDVIMRSSIPE
jgi:hypothetical protein